MSKLKEAFLAKMRLADKLKAANKPVSPIIKCTDDLLLPYSDFKKNWYNSTETNSWHLHIRLSDISIVSENSICFTIRQKDAGYVLSVDNVLKKIGAEGKICVGGVKILEAVTSASEKDLRVLLRSVIRYILSEKSKIEIELDGIYSLGLEINNLQ